MGKFGNEQAYLVVHILNYDCFANASLISCISLILWNKKRTTYKLRWSVIT